jgi:glucose dehydrogenase
MTRLPHVDSARRFFRDAAIGFHRPARLAHAAATIGFGLAISCSGAIAQNAAKGSPDHIKAVTSAVDSASIKANTATSKDWPTYGLDYAETRFSKLNQINTDNVKNLGLMWTYNLESVRGVEATPLVVDGIMYVTASWSVVHAVDARAEYGVRGYITTYHAETGEQAWRWFAVPGDPNKPFEDASMEAAAKTWDPAGKWWINGGGGTPWDTITFDPDLNMIYIGTGNGSPWNRNLRSPAGGDNLYLASIVALNADTGKYVWHYQETPGDSWDYTSTQPMILADINVDGAPRKVILHAPKNGFFFVIDRTNGKFISAKNFVDVNWATGYDANGRPIEVAEARGDKPFDSIPGPYGAHNWHPMSFNPQTGLVYIPAQNIPVNLTGDKTWTHNSNNPGQPHSGLGWNLGYFANVEPPKSQPFGRLIAWDPVKQQHSGSKTMRRRGTAEH